MQPPSHDILCRIAKYYSMWHFYHHTGACDSYIECLPVL